MDLTTQTPEEYLIPPNLTLVSKTDLKGTILDCNDSFQIASGYTRDELIGSPHNIVRHPDVPSAVFKDMWKTLQSGMPWVQIVKNRRQDGGHYWVRANVTPLFDEQGKINGYLSVREPITEAEKAQAAKAYQQLKSGHASIDHGEITTGFNWQKLNLWSKLNARQEMVAVALLVGVIPITLTHTLFNASLEVIVTLSVFMLIAAWLLGHYLHRHLMQARQFLLQLASGKQILKLNAKPTYIGKIYAAIQSSALALGANRSNFESEQDRANQLQMAVDQAWVNMMMVDADGNITYLNQQLQNFFEQKQSLLQKALPDFNANDLLGQPISLFNTQNQTLDPANFNQQETETQLHQIDALSFCLKIVPIKNRSDLFIGCVVEWEDKTKEDRLLKEVEKLHQGILIGDLQYRINLDNADQAMLPVAETLNMTLDSIVNSIDMATQTAINMSMGNFQQEIHQPCPGYFGVVKESLMVSMENISDILSGVQEVAGLIDTDSQSVRQASTTLSESAQQQAASIEETSASMEQMTSSVANSSEHAGQAAQKTSATAQKAANGVQVMADAITSMEAISTASQRIGDIIGLIDSIAFQTNLLALNAAVEAARAGEHGRGFAVVAGEVRNLAGKSADAAKEIRQLIEDTLEKVEQGSNYVNNSGQALNEIQLAVQEVDDIIAEISQSSHEQSQGISQVNIAISSIDTAVQQTAAMAEQNSQTAQQLETLTYAMTQNAQTFKIQPKNHPTALASDANFVRIRMAHRQWRAKAKAYIHGFDVGVDPSKATDPKACELGQWIYGSGQRFAHTESFKTLEVIHQSMHAQIGKIIELKSLGDAMGAEKELMTLEDLSHQVIECINQIEALVAKENQRSALPTP